MDGYMKNESFANERMLQAANIAGKAIDIAQTTAGHAMSYKLTGLYGIAHGHAAALCVSKLWSYIATHLDYCVDSRGRKYLADILERIARAMGCETIEASIEKFQDICKRVVLTAPVAKEEDYKLLRESVNPIRLKNSPIILDIDAIDSIYHEILASKEG